MDFSEALKWLKDGGKATRNNWEPYGQYVTYKAALTELLPDGEHRRFEPFLLLNRWGMRVPWQPTVSDVLAEDWLVATMDGTIQWPDGTVA
jgi:hypothetical protein